MHTKSTKTPSYLYRYLSLNADNAKDIEDMFIFNLLYFQSSEQFNDPFDCKIPINFDGSPDEYRIRLDEVYRWSLPELDEAQRKQEIERFISLGTYKEFSKKWIERRAKVTGVLCLTEEKNNILMWSYYASSHTGFCLEFATDSPFFERVKDVRYHDNYPEVSFVKSSYEEIEDVLFFIKASAWRQEKEWRLFNMVQPSRLLVFPRNMLTGVIFGCQMNNVDKEKIIEWIKKGQLSPKLFQAKKRKERFGLDIIPL